MTPAERVWEDALTAYAIASRDAGAEPATIERTTRWVRAFAAEIDRSPWTVVLEDILDWLARRVTAGWKPNTARTARYALRSFYRWAYASNRVEEDPSIEPSRRAQQLAPPEAWKRPLADYRSSLRAGGKSPETVRTRCNAVRRFAIEHPSLDPFEVTLDDLLDWFGSKRWMPETRKVYRDALQSFYRWAVDTERTTTNPAKKLAPIRGSAPRPRPVSEHDYRAALAKANPDERIMLRLGAELGLRRGEVALVHSRDIEGTEFNWSLRVHGKGDKERIIPLPDDLAIMLRARGEGWILRGRGGRHTSAAHIGKVVSDLLPAGVTMHALRHRFATLVYAVDRDVFATQQLLGHSSPATTQRYVAVPEEGMRRLVNAIPRPSPLVLPI